MAGWAEGFEQTGSRLWPGFSGVLLMEAVKQTFAIMPQPVRARMRPGRRALAPAGGASAAVAPLSASPAAGISISPLESGGEALSFVASAPLRGETGDAAP